MSDHDHDDDGLGSRISGSIHEHVDRLSPGRVSLHDVRQRAGRIRRRRRIAVAAAGAAVAAVVVPTALLTLPGPAGDDAPAPVASGSASPTTATSPVDVVLRADPVDGEDPRIAWMQDETLHRPDGSEQETDRSYQQFVEVGSRLYGSYADEGGVLDIIEDGEVVDSLRVNDAPVVSRDGSMVAWAEPDSTVTVATEDGETDLGRQTGMVMPVAVHGDARCGVVEGENCVVDYNRGEGGAATVTSNGQAGDFPGTLSIADVLSLGPGEGHLTAAQTSYDGGRACSRLFNFTTGDQPWETCDYALGRFSPDSRHLLALPSDIDGLGSRTLSVLSVETGEPVATWSTDQGFVAAQVWEDDEHVLVVRYSFATASWDVLRLGLDGTVQRALEPVGGIAEDRPITLAGNR